MTYLAIEQAAHSRWPWVPFRRLAVLRRTTNSRSDRQLLSVSAAEGVRPRPADGGRQLPSDSTIESYWQVEPNDLVFNPMWAIEGGVAVSDHVGAVSTAYRVYALGARVFPRFVHYFARSRVALDQYRLLVRGVTTFDRSIAREDFEGMPFPVPSLAEQRDIARYLDVETARIDQLIAKKRRMVSMLEKRRRDEISAHVLRGLDPVHGVRPATFPRGWSIGRLGVVIELHRGHDLPTEGRIAGDVPVVSSGGISGWHDVAVCDPPGVITGRYGTIGEVFYVDVPYWPLNTTLYVSDFRDCSPRWVYYLLQALPLDYDAAKSAVTGINRNVIGGLTVPVPPRDEQDDIARRLDHSGTRSEMTTAAIRRQVELLHEHRQALIAEAVTGELAIPGVSR